MNRKTAENRPMIKLISEIAIIFCLLAASVISAVDKNIPPPGSYGFDWLKPNKAQCQRISPQLMKKFRGCEYNNPGGFGLGNPSYRCRINSKREYIVFSDRKTCIEELETMKANAP